jgi:O-antigen/teichoic acid export membrane protein
LRRSVAQLSLKANVIANYLGQGWRAVMGLAFIPVYVQYVGIEGYGMIGLFATAQGLLTILDLGTQPTLTREMARSTVGVHDARSLRDVLRTVEVIALAIMAVVTLTFWAAADWLATEWIDAQTLPTDMVARVFALMGVVGALRFAENVYISALIGLQRQVLQNVVTSIIATARAAGAVAILAWVSPTLDAFFLWQGVVSLASVALLSVVVYQVLPASPQRGRFSRTALIGMRSFAAGMALITVLALLLTHIDKILLSRLLPLAEFSHYALAATVANVLYMLTTPITNAFYPRFVELVARNDEAALRYTYHQAAQLMTVLAGATAALLMIFGDRIMLLWTGEAALAAAVAQLLAVITLGSLCNELMWMPYQLQLAHGWTALSIKINAVAVVVFVPALFWLVPSYGGIGAAWVWVALNAMYLIFTIHFMHRRLLQTEKWRWYAQDVMMPLAAALSVAGLCRWIIPTYTNKLLELSALALIGGGVLLCAALSAPMVRRQLAAHMPGRTRVAGAAP